MFSFDAPSQSSQNREDTLLTATERLRTHIGAEVAGRVKWVHASIMAFQQRGFSRDGTISL